MENNYGQEKDDRRYSRQIKDEATMDWRDILMEEGVDSLNDG
ncbi:MAG: hypothetical protein NTV06_01695 [candidate division Zixibacteria bacterium]|nr:hypothetical protein [candidate division Zixibacteria bacterium]